ncbi:MAG: molybdopterin molybdotransferase MoeA [Rhizobiaceae bacterium]
MSGLLSVKDALARILDGVEPLGPEDIPLTHADGRILAQDLAAKRTQPPFCASAMDGYAVRAEDIAETPVKLTMVGESAAGHGYAGHIGDGECVRIFTGAPVPEGADSIVIQENAQAAGNRVTFCEPVVRGNYIRPAGMDFSENAILLNAGQTLDPASLSLAAAMNHPTLPVRRKPVIAIIASGDELVLPGNKPAPDQIVASNSFGVSAIVSRAGGRAFDCGIANDNLTSLAEKFEAASKADIVVTLGGASVGDHDLVRDALEARGVDLSFWKLAMRPGKPVMFGIGTDGDRKIRYIGLPGNPVSSLVCAHIFVAPLIQALLGLPSDAPRLNAKLAVALPKNDQREEYMRATVETRDGERFITPFKNQDSSLLSLYARAHCLMVRPAHAPASKAGEDCEIILLG